MDEVSLTNHENDSSPPHPKGGPDWEKVANRISTRLRCRIRADRIMTDPLMRYAYSADASAYRLVPALVVIVNSEAEVREVIAAARAEGMPLTFRAAGTSLSGQAMTEGVLAVLGDSWRKLQIHDAGARVTLGPGNIVAQVNRALKRFNRKLGPDPASQAACKIGGVVNNNASGMCCGVAYNTYHTMERLRVMLADGTVLDSGDPASVAEFRSTHAGLLEGLAALHREVTADAELVALIRRKYRIKNTVGYSINALVDFHDPVDILVHLIVGSEGTLGFVSEVTYRTIDEHPHKATELVVFSDPHSCGRAISRLANDGVQNTTGVVAAEYMERRALSTVEHVPVIAPYVKHLNETSPAVLIDIAAPDAARLEAEIAKATEILRFEGAININFSTDADKAEALWDVRKGFFASAGSARKLGTTLMTEDVAAPVDRLAEFILDLRSLLDRCGYTDATILGHALSGNLHFLMADDFSVPGAPERFGAFSTALCDLVSLRYHGSLKAEHGTGRAIAPFVEAEWGSTAYVVMQRIKRLFDPEGLLNPGVLITPDKHTHLRNFKAMSQADPLIDLCVECGLCEPHCPSTQLTLSPRQRIAVTRERARLKCSGEEPDRLAVLERDFGHAGLTTCAAGNVCSLHCPVGIETGTMVIGQRTLSRSDAERRRAGFVASHTAAVERGMKLALGAQDASRAVFGNRATDALSDLARRLSGGLTPRLSSTLRRGPGGPQTPPEAAAGHRRVIYFPACPTRIFGAPAAENGLLSTPEAMIALLRRAGFDPIMPKELTGQCCGQPFLSKGFPEEAERLEARLFKCLTDDPQAAGCEVVTDASTCARHMSHQSAGLQVSDSAVFLQSRVLPQLTVARRLPVVAVHYNCSAQKLDEQDAIDGLAAALAERVAPLSSVGCCGYAGDKGLFVPELNQWATRFARKDIPPGCTIGISTVSTCAAGLSERVGIPFVSIASLLEAATRPDHHLNRDDEGTSRYKLSSGASVGR